MVSRETNRAKRSVSKKNGGVDMRFHKRWRAKRQRAAVNRALHDASNGKDFNLDVKGTHVAAWDIS